MARRYYSSTAARTTLATGVNDTTTTLSVTAVSGWPTSFPYTLIIDADTVNEEIVEVSARSGTTLTVTRGVDGTSAVAHSSGAAVQHGVSARDFDEPNAFINGTGTVTETLLATGAVTEAKLGTGAVTSLKILDGTIMDGDINASAAIAQSKISGLTSDLASKVDYATPTNAQSGTGASAYTFVLADASRLTTATGSSAKTFTIPPQANVAWVANSIIRVANYGTGALTIAGGSGVTVTNASKTLAQFESAALVRTGSNAWTLIPFSGGAGNADFSNAATGTYTDGGISYKYVTFPASGTLTVTKAGFADVLLVGGGGGGGLVPSGAGTGGGGGGAGGHLTCENVYLPAGSLTVTVGAGGAGGTGGSRLGTTGQESSLGVLFAIGGGGGGAYSASNLASAGIRGGSGGGGGAYNTTAGAVGGSGTATQGNNGGTGALLNNAAGGGGGAGAVGANASGTTAGNGGSGVSNSYTGSSVTRAGGGGGGTYTGTAGTGGSGGGGAGSATTTGTAGTANTGGGGGGAGGLSAADGGAGGSGVVIVRVKV